MPIITVNESKTLLQIADSSYDVLLKALIPLAQEKVINYTHNSFVNPLIQLDSSSLSFKKTVEGEVTIYTIESSNELFTDYDFTAGDYKVVGSKYNDGIYTVSEVADLKLTVDATNLLPGFPEEESEEEYISIMRVQFPKAIQLEVAVLLQFLLTQKGKLVESESLPGGYSVKYKDEKSLMSIFNSYRKPY